MIKTFHATTSRRALLAGAPAVAAAALAAATVTNAIAIAQAKAASLDWPAIVMRADGMIAGLRNYYGPNKWTAADEEAAGRVLKYFRDGAPDNEDEWTATIEFIGRHGQSLDWVFYGDPGTMEYSSWLPIHCAPLQILGPTRSMRRSKSRGMLTRLIALLGRRPRMCTRRPARNCGAPGWPRHMAKPILQVIDGGPHLGRESSARSQPFLSSLS